VSAFSSGVDGCKTLCSIETLGNSDTMTLTHVSEDLNSQQCGKLKSCNPFN